MMDIINHEEDDARIDALPDDTQLQIDDDRISELPDDILIHILEFLDLPITIQASALSRRWRHLPRMLSRLLIDVADFMPPRQLNRAVDHIMTTYSDAVRTLLSGNRSIKHLQLSFYLTDPYLCTIGHIVGDVAESHKINFLELTLWKDVADPSFEQCILFGHRFMSFFHACTSTFRHLTRLILHDLIFQDSDVRSLIDTCSKLRALSLTSCDTVTGSEYVLKIDAPCSELVTLEFITCGFARVDLIHVPKLGRVVCNTWYDAILHCASELSLAFTTYAYHVARFVTRRHLPLWKAPLPLSIRIFVWQLLRDRLPSGVEVLKRNGPGEGRCPLCGTPETCAHIMFSCSAAQFLWSFVREALGPAWQAQDLGEFLQAQANRTGGGRRLFWLLFAALAWTLWNVRNKMVIERIFPTRASDSVFTVLAFLQQWSPLVRPRDRAGFESSLQALRTAALPLAAPSAAAHAPPPPPSP